MAALAVAAGQHIMLLAICIHMYVYIYIYIYIHAGLAVAASRKTTGFATSSEYVDVRLA